ncbi:radical SAM protein [Thalassococcus profundi]|nr:radical SAM protein [Thalassococcus profundi]
MSIHEIEDVKQLRSAPNDLPESLANVVEYRKSGLSLNHVVGCPLDCGYCVRHLFGNFEMKRPHLIMSDEQAVDELLRHWAFVPHRTPLQIFNRATDPFLPNVKPHLLNSLSLLDQRGLTNHILVITRWKVTPDDVAKLERLQNLKVTVLVTWSGINDVRLEPVDSEFAERSLKVLAEYKSRTKCILYWRPIIAGVNDTDHCIAAASALSQLADATVFTGLFHREQIRAHFRSSGVEDLYNDVPRRKILPREVEKRVLKKYTGAPLFRKTSCGVAFAHAEADYNGHFGITNICNICPQEQISLCASGHQIPLFEKVAPLVKSVGLNPSRIEIRAGNVIVEGSTEQQRYYVQHSLGFQVHDRSQPHLPGRHGRAEEGWE